MAVKLLGKSFNAALTQKLATRIAMLKMKGITPTLAIVRVGERLDDLSYERSVVKRAEALGVQVNLHSYDESITEEELAKVITSINEDSSVHGCLLFRPLPVHIDEHRICDMLDPEKDVDGVTLRALAGLFTGDRVGYAPCTAQACIDMLDFYEIPIAGRHVAVIGRSLVVGKPLAMLLLGRNASVTMLHSQTEDLPKLMKSADIVVCATGRPCEFGPECFAPGQVVLDVGINFMPTGKMCGDVDYDSVEPLVEAISPVPGGIGAVTTGILISNVVESARREQAKAHPHQRY